MLFNGWFGAGSGVETGFGDSEYADPILGVTEPLSYQQCKDIYTYWPLGRRVASSLPTFALSAGREFSFGDFPGDCASRFVDTLTFYGIDDLVKHCAIYARVFGLAGIYVVCDKVDETKPLTHEDIQESVIGFNLLDPLILNGVDIDQNPLSLNYQKITAVKINGAVTNPKRVVTIFNDMTFYLRWVTSTFNWGSTSIYQNMVALIKSWNRCVLALERIATKAGALVVKSRDGSVLNAVTLNAAKRTLNLIRNLQNDGAASVEKDTDIEFFSLTGVGEVDAIIEQMNSLILMALSDTPASLLLDKELARGFSDGREDMKSLLIAVDSFRRNSLSPLYAFLDKIMLSKAFNDSFLNTLKEKYPQDLNNTPNSVLREEIMASYKFTWGNLYPDTETETLENQGLKLDNLMKLKDLGANLSDIETLINGDYELYSHEITLEKENLIGDDFDADTQDDFDEDERHEKEE